MKKVLIIGGAGFIGYHLAKRLLNYEYQIDLLDDFSRGVNDIHLQELISKNKRINLISADMLQSTTTKIIDDSYTYIYHLAAIIGVQHVLKDPFGVLTKNFNLLKNAIEIARCQKKLERFVFSSTSEVYAGTLSCYGLDFPTPEITPLTITSLHEPRTSYMLSKIYGESMCVYSDLPVTIIRPHNFYGPRMGLSHVIPELMKKVVDTDNGMIDVFSIRHKRTFCYIDDAVEMIKLLAESEKTIGESYNIGNDDEEITMSELAQKVIDLSGKHILINPKPSTAGSPERRCPSMEKIKNKITITKNYKLDQGLEKTFFWYKKNVFSEQDVYAV